jgi:hypothetical protein
VDGPSLPFELPFELAFARRSSTVRAPFVLAFERRASTGRAGLRAVIVAGGAEGDHD